MIFESTLDIEDTDELAAALFPKKHVMLVHGISVLFVVWACIGFMIYNIDTGIAVAVVCLLGIIFIEVILKVQKKKYTKNLYKRFHEIYKTNQIRYQYSLGEDSIHISNLNTDAKGEMKYSIFKRMKDTEHYLLLITQAGQYVVFDRKAAEEQKLKQYFVNKCNLG